MDDGRAAHFFAPPGCRFFVPAGLAGADDTEQAELLPEALLRLRGHRPDQRLELRAHRQIEALARRQPPQEPALVLALDLSVLRQVVERLLYERRKLRVILAEHDAVGIVGKKFTDDLEVLLRLVLREE